MQRGGARANIERAVKTAVKAALKYGAPAGVSYLAGAKGKKAAVSTGRSYTVTKTKRKNNKGKSITHVSPDLHYNHGKATRYSDKFSRKVREAAAAIDTQTIKGTMQMTSNIGQCNYAVPHLLYDPDHMVTLNSHLSGYPDGKFLVRNAISTIQLANARNSCANIRIYECQARTDVPYQSGAYVTPYNYLITGWTDAGLASTLNDIAGNAFSSSAFCTWFKVLDVKVITLNPGECKRLTLEDKQSTSINMERWHPGGSKLSIAHARKTKFFLFQYWGQTVNDSVTEALVSTDAVKIDCLHTVKYTFQYVLDQNKTNYTSGALDAVAIPEFVNENTSAIITGASA